MDYYRASALEAQRANQSLPVESGSVSRLFTISLAHPAVATLASPSPTRYRAGQSNSPRRHSIPAGKSGRRDSNPRPLEPHSIGSTEKTSVNTDKCRVIYFHAFTFVLVLWAIWGNVAAMPRRYTLSPVRSSWAGNHQWKVEIPARYSLNGKRQRSFFETRADAEVYAEEQRIRIQNFGTQGASILPPAHQEQAHNAIALLEPYGVSLNEVVQDWISRKKAAEASITYEAAMDAFMEWRKRSDSYVRSIRQTRNRLTLLHGKLLNTITPADLTRAMDGMPPSVRNFTLRILGGLFNFGAKRGFCADNPVRRMDLSQRDPTEIQIHTVEEIATIMAAAEKHQPALVPFLAVSFFCGIRRAEALRLDWSAIELHENFVKLPASITKTKQGRHIEISDNCHAWLAPHAKGQGRIFPHSENVLRDRLAELREQHNVRTIKHGPRHSFASYWLAQHGDINRLCRFLGHDDPETTFRHYAKAATAREAKRFWAVMPKKKQRGEKIVEFPAKGAA